MRDSRPATLESSRDGSPEHIQVHAPIDVRSASLAILALIASVYALHWASAVFIPLMLSVMFSYILSPVVNRMERWHIPRALGTAAILLGVLAGMGVMAHSLGDEAATLVESLPDAAQKLRQSLRSTTGAPAGPMEKVQRAGEKLEEAAAESGSRPPAAVQGVTRVQVERTRFNVKDYLWSGTLGLVGFIGQALVVLFITFFLIASGDSFRRKMVRLAGPTLTQKKITLEMLDEITAQVQRYLRGQIYTSILVGVATWLALLWIGLKSAAVWGIAGGILNLVPYVGAIAVTGGSALVGFLQFGNIGMAALIGGVSVLIHGITSYLITPWLTSRSSNMNPVAIFVGVLAWGWLWGVWGLLLGIPLMMAVKAVCDRVDDLKPISELLGS